MSRSSSIHSGTASSLVLRSSECGEEQTLLLHVDAAHLLLIASHEHPRSPDAHTHLAARADDGRATVGIPMQQLEGALGQTDGAEKSANAVLQQ